LPVTFASHLPLQEDLHFAEQSAVGGVPLQDALHLALQFAEQWPLHSAVAVPPPACAWQVASQSVLQEPSQLPAQLYVPGSTVHFALQSDSHEPVQAASMEPVHWPSQLTTALPSHAAWKLTGVHFAVQPPDVSTVHLASALTLMFPHDSSPA
jgi:hypothetical protein